MLFFTVNITVYVPADLYVWLGDVVVLAPPSPKFQRYDPVLLLFVNDTAVPAQASLAEKSAVGVPNTVTLTDLVSVQPAAFSAVNVTVKLPEAVYVCDGLVAVEAALPSPKFHWWLTMYPSLSLLVLVKLTVSPSVGVCGFQ